MQSRRMPLYARNTEALACFLLAAGIINLRQNRFQDEKLAVALNLRKTPLSSVTIKGKWRECL